MGLQRLGPVLGGGHPDALRLEDVAHRVADRGVVVDDEDRAGHEAASAGAAPACPCSAASL